MSSKARPVVYDSTRKTRGNRPRGFTSSQQQPRRPSGPPPPDERDDEAQPIHPTMKVLTVASALASCLFLNPLAFSCVIPAIYYSFCTNGTKAAQRPREGRRQDRAWRALVWNFLSFLSYIPYTAAIICAVYFTTATKPP